MDECQSLDEVKAKVEDVDLFIPEMPPVVREHAQLAWSQASPDHFTMWYHGENFPERVDLKQDMLGQWSRRDGQRLQVGQEDRAAAGVAPGSVRRRREVDVGQPWPRLRAEEPEGRLAEGAPTNAQVREIRRQGIDVDWSKMNAGQVADMLDFRKAQALSRARVRAGAA